MTVIHSPVRPVLRNTLFNPLADEWGSVALPFPTVSGVAARYQPSDPTSLFQLRSGGSNSSSHDDAIGVAIDKAAMGDQTAAEYIAGLTDLISNGDFSSGDLTGWDTALGAGSSATVTDGAAVLTSGGAASDVKLRQSITATNGTLYQVSLEVTASTGDWFSLNIGGAGITSRDYDIKTLGQHTALVKAQATGSHFLNIRNNFGGGSMTLDNIEVREVPGNHLIADDDDARPKLDISVGVRSFLWDGVDDILIGNAFWAALGSNTLIAAVSGASSSDKSIIIETRASDGAPTYEIMTVSGEIRGTLRNDAVTNQYNRDTTGSELDSIWKVISLEDTTAAANLRVGGSLVASGVYTRAGTYSMDVFSLGGRKRATTDRHFAGKIGDIVIASAMSAEDRAAVEAYVAHNAKVVI